MSVDEIISTLQHSSLPTIFIEGSDDVIVYRNIENILSDKNVSIFPVGGRPKVLDIYNRRSELPKNMIVAFIVDKDRWSFEGIPQKYIDNKIICTNGYSIENDVYNDGSLYKLLHANEIARFDEELEKFIYWYAIAFNRHLKNGENGIDNHPNDVINNYVTLTKLNEQEAYPEDIKFKIKEDYKNLLRGKSLINLLIRNISYSGRNVKHHSKSLMELVGINPGPLISSIYERVEKIFI